jgi:hypothetical protein
MQESASSSVNFLVHLIDGSCHHYRQTDSKGLEGVLEYLRRTKVFTPENLIFHINNEQTVFPSHAVSRLEIVTTEQLTHICSPTWRDSEELTPDDYRRTREEIHGILQTDRAKLVRDGVFTLLLSYHLLGGYQVHVKCQVTRNEDNKRPELIQSDLGMLNQHTPPPVITIGRLGGGLTFLNSANILRMVRCPGAQERPLNALVYAGEELSTA